MQQLRLILARIRLPFKMNLINKFSVLSFLLCLIVAASLAWGIQKRLEEATLQQEAENAADVMALILVPQMTTEDFNTPIGSERYLQIDTFIRGSVITEDVVRVKIWNREGVVIYSDDRDLVGHQYPIDDHIQEALEGRIQMEITSLEDKENRDIREQYEKLIEIYVPVSLNNSIDVTGVFEIYYEYSGLEARINTLSKFVWGSVFIGFAVFYVVLFNLVRGASRELVRQSEENSSLYQEVKLQLEDLKRAETALLSYATKLEQSNQELERYAFVASHDLKEPLRMVSLYTELLAERYKGKLDKDADEYISYVIEGANRMYQLTNDLLVYSSLNTESDPSDLVDLGEVVDEVIENCKQSIDESGAMVVVNGLPKLSTDHSQMIQLFQNLVENAIKYRGASPPKIVIGAERENGDWVFSVQDNGIGIETHLTGRIFDAFKRLHRHEHYPGTGIGLAICKKIVEGHGGRIWVESEPEVGSTFHFTIPNR